MKRLDPAAILLSGTQLIEASAGTGKTYTIATLFLRLVLSGYRVPEILVVTFTEAATAELRDRLRARLREALSVLQKGVEDEEVMRLVSALPETEVPAVERRLLAALSGFDEAAVMTIHGFCHRMLQEHAFESGVLFDAEFLTDPSLLYEEIARDFWAIEVYGLPVAWVRFLEEKKITPQGLSRLLQIVAGNPDRRILPDLTGGSRSIADFERLFCEARNIWLSEEKVIRDILTTHEGVNRNSYKQPHLNSWLDNVAGYFSRETPQRLPGEKDLSKFASSRLIETAQKKKNAPAPPTHRFFEICEILCRFGDEWAISFQRRFVATAIEMLADRKKELGIVFFDDLIQALDRALAGPGGPVLAERIRKRYRAALIDEFQDTDQAQYRIFRSLYQGTGYPFFLIGDPKQSIYAFRGADIFAYMQAVRDAGDRPHNLDINWRSDPSLISAVNTLFDAGRVTRPFGFREIGYTPVTPRDGATDRLLINGRPEAALQFLLIQRNDDNITKGGFIKKEWIEDHLPAMVAGDICRLLSGKAVLAGGEPRPLGPGDVAVLVRTNRQMRQIQAALRKVGIPCVVTSGESVFTSPESFEFLQLLYAVENPADDIRISNALSTDFFGLTGTDIFALRAGGTVWEGWLMQFRNWHRLWHAGGVAVLFQQVFSFIPSGNSGGLLLGLLALTDGERRVTNFQHIAELLHAAAVREHLGPAGLIRWFERQRSGRQEASDVHELRLESDAMAVQAVTIHKSKGLEYPVVYAPYLWDGKLHNGDKAPALCHNPGDLGEALFDLGSARIGAHLQQAAAEEMAENIRLLYVALTRARHSCRVVWGAVNDFQTSALGYLLHHPGGDVGFAEAARQMKDLDDVQILEALGALEKKGVGTIGLCELPPGGSDCYTPSRPDIPDLICRKGHRIPERRWRIESFSKLVADVSHTSSPEEEIGLDHDQRTGALESRIAGGKPGAEGGRVLLADFSRGADAGTFFHAVYEKIDFTQTDPLVHGQVISEALSAHGFNETAWREVICRAVAGTLACGLDADRKELHLNRISNDRRFNELEFVFPVANHAGIAQTRVTAKSLADVVSKHPGPANTPAYLKRLSHLRFPAIEGFLKGFIDMVFEYEGRWYLVDYKSNHLGDAYADYGGGALSRAMTNHHYFLQYHLYTVALHRYLSLRLPDYDYDAHFGAVYYLFIRGMSPDTGHLGVFKDRPEKALIASLSALFES
jgi:exodeoxyribonuclease V beta subunit